jgi:hypothetical protein
MYFIEGQASVRLDFGNSLWVHPDLVNPVILPPCRCRDGNTEAYSMAVADIRA